MTPKEEKQVLASFIIEGELTSEWFSKIEAARTKAIETYGIDGFRLAIANHIKVFANVEGVNVFHCAHAPQNPWSHLADKTLSDAIDLAWEKFPVPFVSTLKKYCIDLFVVQNNQNWTLVYPHKDVSLDDSPCYQYLAGHAPEMDPQLPLPLQETGWYFPNDLRQLYSVHHGFGSLSSAFERRGSAYYIVPVQRLSTSLSFLNEVAKENNWEIDYDFDDLLPFFNDGKGNSQNFYKKWAEHNSYATVDWDHETKEISIKGESLAEFMEDRLGDELRRIDFYR